MMLVLCAVIALPEGAALHAQPVERPSGPREETLDRRDPLLDIDSARFQVQPFAGHAKVSRVTYTNADMVVTPASLRRRWLYIAPDPADVYCADRSINRALFNARLTMGEKDYEFDTVNFDITVILRIFRFEGATQIGPQFCTLKVSSISNDVKPEQWYRTEFTSDYDDTDSFEVMVQSYSFSTSATALQTALRNNVRLDVWYSEEFAIGATMIGAPTTPPITIRTLSTVSDRVVANPVTFAWDLATECVKDSFPNYQFQLLRLFNRSEDSAYTSDEERVIDTLDWSRALTIETGNKLTALTLTVAEGTGYYVWRVRPVGEKYPGGIANDRNWGPWTQAPGNGHLAIDGLDESSVDTLDRPAVFFYQSPGRERNWIYARTFSEGTEGTRVAEKMTYATELLQPRQTQAHMQSSDSMLVDQTVYDFSGRASLASLAAPRSWNGFGYQTGFMNPASSSTVVPYTAENFDTDANYTNPGSVALSSLVGQYYSDGTPRPDLRIPNADGYPFHRTLFYPDASGRVSEQGGAGTTFRIGGGAELDGSSNLIARTVRTFYGKASSDELIALFGDEAPADGTVQKVISVDPNKIASVQFISKEGQTLATCLVKPASATGLHLTELGNETAVIDDTVQQRVGANIPSGEFGAQANTTVTLMEKGPLYLHYVFSPNTLETSCLNTCSTCDYTVEILVVPAHDPLTPVFTRSFMLPAEVCSGGGAPIDTSFMTSDLVPGSYAVIRRIRSGGTNGDGERYRDAGARAEADTLRSLIDTRLLQVRAYLDSANLTGLYSYLDSLDMLDAELSYDAEAKEYTIEADCYTLRVPRLLCDPDNPCVDSTPDFEGYLFKRWGPGNYAYNGDTSKHFGNTLDKYFYTRHNWEPTFDTLGRFNTLVANMLAKGDEYPEYNCARLWAIWRDLVDGFGYVATEHHAGNPEDRSDRYNLLEEFLRRAGTHYKGISTCMYGDCSIKPVNDAGHALYFGFGMGYLDHAFEYYRYTDDNPATAECRKLMGLVSGGSVLPLITYEPLPGGSPTAYVNLDPNWTEEQYTMFHDCLMSRKPEGQESIPDQQLPNDCGDPNGEECALALRDAMQDTCRSMCERKRAGFRASVVDAWHLAGRTIEGERETPEGQPVNELGVVFNENGDSVGTITFIPKQTVDCQAALLVEHCKEYCTLDAVYTDGRLSSIGTVPQRERYRKPLGYSWTVAIPEEGECAGGFDSVGMENDPQAYAGFVVRAMNDTLRKVRRELGDTADPLTVSTRLHDAFTVLTGDTTVCNWHELTTTHHADSGCCPPMGLPKMFTFGAHITSWFELEGCALVYRRVCTVDDHIVVQREILCDSVCLQQCAQPLCFRWDSLTAPVPTAVVEPYTCEQLMAAEIRRGLAQQVDAVLSEHRIATVQAYNAACGDPNGFDDTLTVSYPTALYHFTLYYYDRAGRLVRTVPPAGVVLNATNRATHPNHTLVTSYEYNSLGQLVRKRTPDAGVTWLWYDSKSRARFVQSAEQRIRDAFTYTKYDELGRAVETGESATDTLGDLISKADDMAWPGVAAVTDAYRTTYTSASGRYYLNDSSRAQRYLRNRASVVEALDGSHATHYSYDPHGNVEWIVQFIRGLGDNYMRYEYDLVSGNMLALYYNEGLGDQLTQRWSYDEDNRITCTESSRDGVIWDRDVTYHYFLHGPLRRAEYGEDSLQGTDYTYTLQGWMKGINHPSLDTTIDPANDGDITSGAHARYAMDGFGMMLTYFEGDFLRKQSSTQAPFNSATVGAYTKRADALGPEPETGGGVKNLYNGNIASWTSNTKPAGSGRYYEYLTGEQYTYDRLNRLLSSTFNDYSSVWASNGDYATGYTYDPNGNIKTLMRATAVASGRRPMDSLKYWYPPTSNRLLHVDDTVSAGSPSTDLDDQTPFNYVYDASGRLVGDRLEGIGRITWKNTNKVRSVFKASGMITRFGYDAAGERVKKAIVAGGSGSTTYYVREAGGRVIAIYTKACIDAEDAAPGSEDGCYNRVAVPDADRDGIPDARDNAPNGFNPDQRDTDGDGTGDVIEADADNDGISDVGDPCPFDPANSCTGDADSDGIPDAVDPCPDTPGHGGPDRDSDGTPDDCDQDLDGDGVANHEDNCPWTPNSNQADGNSNGVGNVCECSSGGDGGCGIALAEQYVYGSEPDGRVVTIQPNRTRDMNPTSGITIFTRVMRQREYELNDHLGNVRLRFSDLKRSTVTAGIAPFVIDMRGYANYYPFGMAQPGREMQFGATRYGYNGKEMDNEWNNRDGAVGELGTGNSYDYGARIYEPRLGRWTSCDPASHLYPGNSPYEYALNNPVQWLDADGAVVRDQFGNIIFSVIDLNALYELGPYKDPENSSVGASWVVPSKMGAIMNDGGTYIQVYETKQASALFLISELEYDHYGRPHRVLPPLMGYIDYSETDSRYNCTGNALTDQHFIINSDQITRQYLVEENFRQVDLIDAQTGDVGIYVDANGVTQHLEIFLTSQVVNTKGGVEFRPGTDLPGVHPEFSKTMSYSVWRKNGPDIRILPPGFNGPILPNEIVSDLPLPGPSSDGVVTVPSYQFQKIHDKVLQHRQGAPASLDD